MELLTVTKNQGFTRSSEYTFLREIFTITLQLGLNLNYTSSKTEWNLPAFKIGPHVFGICCPNTFVNFLS